MRGRYARGVQGQAAMLGALALCALLAASPAPRDARDIPLVDQDGRRFTVRELGRPAAVIFVATRCGDACPMAEAVFASLARELERLRADAALLTVTLEPEYDAPLVMANAARRFGADARRWRWAGGESRAVRGLLDAFGVARIDRRFHGAFCYVLDRSGRPVRIVPLSAGSTGELLALLRAGAR